MNMQELSEKTGLVFDGDEKDLRLHLEEMHHVFAEIMTEEEYDAMEEEMGKAVIKGNGYKVYAWNDVSGYEYWKENDGNYIQVTVYIEDGFDLSKIDAGKMKNDAERLFCDLSHWNNVEEYYHKKIEESKNV